MAPKSVRVHMLGGLCLQVRGRHISRFRTRKTATLLACLAYHAGQSFRREEIVEMLWPDSDLASGRQSLSTCLTSLRLQMEPPGTEPGSVLVADRNVIRRSQDGVTCDVHEFRALIREARSAASAIDRCQRLRRALELYSGPLLPGFDETWIVMERERLQEEHALWLEHLAELLEQMGAHHEAIPVAEQALAAAPYCERHYLVLARLHAVYGDRASAKRVLDRLDDMLRQDLGEPSSTAAEALRQQIGSLSAFAEAREIAVPQESEGAPEPSEPQLEKHVPYVASRFFGREQELEAVDRGLTEARIVTITGPGGMGKTRTALEAVRRMWDGSSEAWFVELSQLAHAEEVPAAVVRELGLPPSASESFAQIEERLRAQPALLVLDNFEHVLPAATWVGELIGRVPNLKVLATSRGRLGICDELEVQLKPLPVPAESTAMEPALESPAVALFVDRAQRARADFQITPRNLRSLLVLCAGLEGIPLALELAAARSMVMTPAQMLQEMQHRFTFLVNRRRASVARHQTMEAALQWGFDLLSEGARRSFVSLGVFRGGWSLEAAVAVLGDDRAADWLEELVSASMVRSHESEGELRFGLLESMRAFAFERAAPEQTAMVRKRHFTFFLELAERLAPLVRSPEQAHFVRLMALERENLEDALEYGKSEAPIEGLRLAIACSAFWEVSANTAQSRRWLGEYLALEADFPPELLTQALYALGNLRVFAGEFAGAREALFACLEEARALGRPDMLANALESLSLTLANMGEPAAGGYIEEGLRLAADLGDRSLFARMCMVSAVFNAYEGRIQESIRIANEGLAAADEIGTPFLKARLILCHGSSYLALHDFPQARMHYEEAIQLARQVGDSFVVAIATWGLSLAEFELGRTQEAWDLWMEHYLTLRASGLMWGMPHLLESVSRFEWKERHFQPAVTLFAAAHALRERMQAPYPFGNGDYYGDLRSRIMEIKGNSPFLEAWQRGLAMDWEQAAEFAIRAREGRRPTHA